MPESYRAVLITDRRRSSTPLPALLDRALAGAAPGALIVQLREKDLEGRALAELARALLPVCRARHTPLLMNDRLDVALALDLEGVHLPSQAFPATAVRAALPAGKLLGVSCHSEAEVRAALTGGANFAVFGPLFDTPSKRALGSPLGLAALAKAASIGLPLYGLGGVTTDRAAAVRSAGAVGVAAIAAWMDAADPAAAVAALVG